MTNSTVSNNISTAGSGGGISGSSQGVTLTSSTVNGNQASGDGGGINAATVGLTNSTITGNSATGIGGGVAAAALTTSYSTIASNTSAGAGGGANFSSSAMGQATIFFGNSPDDLATASMAAMTGHYDLVGVTSAGTPMDTISGDPVLAPLADNGGPTQTMALGTGSHAIDAASANPTQSTDQRGYTRPATMSSNADIGAYEAGATDPDKIFANGFES
jgi:hypothetical protein